MAEKSKFTWVQTQKELVKYLLTMRERQAELVDLLVKAGVDGLEKQDANGKTIRISAIDPFTFIFSIYKYDGAKRVKYLKSLTTSIGLTPPTDTDGIPFTDRKAVRNYMWDANSSDSRIQTIWTCFNKAVEHSLTDEDFQALLKIDGIEKPKLSHALFLTDPEYYLILNKSTKEYLNNNYDFNIRNSSFSTYTKYMNLVADIEKKTRKTFLEISYEVVQYYNTNKPLESQPQTHESEGIANDKLKPDPRLNQILYGPPGTGKTYNAIAKAVEIASPEFYKANETSRDEITVKYKELVDQGRVRFTTFHQSLCYEDFIEGIKPLKPQDDQQMRYDVEDGIFKRLSTNALYHIIRRSMPQEETASIEQKFRTAFDNLIEKLNSDNVTTSNVILETKSGNKIEFLVVSDQGNIIVKHEGSDKTNTYTVSANRLFRLFKAFPSIDHIHNVTQDIKAVIGGANYSTYYAVLKQIYQIADAETMAPQEQSINVLNEVDYELIKDVLMDFTLTKDEWDSLIVKGIENYVLIIDEINRGNVSQIFGELITLIEPDKRAGMKEALEVTLPYSKEKFSVPPNLYIIGTMNTADRSVESLDTALRRRFIFEEKSPLYEIMENGTDLMDTKICGYPLKRILETLNNRIKILLDRDHQIGHSYFLGLEKDEELMETFNQKIIPLLQEYFYGDYAMIGLVLGEGFVKKESIGHKELSSFKYDDIESLVKDNYQLVLFHDIDDFKDALKTMMPKNGQTTTDA